MTQPSSSSQLIVWRLTDGKVGHEKQSQSLLESFQQQRMIKSIDIAIKHSWAYYLMHWLLKLNIAPSHISDKPDLVIGTGHKTHLAVLAISRYYRCKSLIIMSPSLPNRWFDAIVAPKHDYHNSTPPKHAVLTPIALAPYVTSQPDPKQGLILLGGESKHYHWNDDTIVKYIKTIMLSDDDTLWQLTSSRRTPASTLAAIKKQCSNKRLIIRQHDNTPKHWLSDQLQTTGNIWVTADSASMLAEALMTKATVQLIMLTPKNPQGKIHIANHYLLSQGFLNNSETDTRKTIDTQKITTDILDVLEL